MKILASITVLFTILSSLAFGIACGHAAMVAVLRVLGPKRRQAEPAPSGAVVVRTASGH